MENLNYSIVRNDRLGYGYKHEHLRCDSCGSLTTRYIIINDVMLCRSCLDKFDKILAKDLLKEIK